MFAFCTRKKYLEVHKLLRRAMDATSPYSMPLMGESRVESRSNRTLPVLLVPCEGSKLVLQDHTIALTKNLSSQGVALVLPQPFRAQEVAIGFWLDDKPQFVMGRVRQMVPLGGGYWQLGVELTERVSPEDDVDVESLLPLMARLKV